MTQIEESEMLEQLTQLKHEVNIAQERFDRASRYDDEYELKKELNRAKSKLGNLKGQLKKAGFNEKRAMQEKEAKFEKEHGEAFKLLREKTYKNQIHLFNSLKRRDIQLTTEERMLIDFEFSKAEYRGELPISAAFVYGYLSPVNQKKFIDSV